MFGYIELIYSVLIISAIAGAGMYVMKLRSDNAILKANQVELERSVESQKKTLAKSFIWILHIIIITQILKKSTVLLDFFFRFVIFFVLL